MVKLTSSYNPQPLVRVLQNRKNAFRKEMGNDLERAGRLIAVSLATSTQPYGFSDSARQKGETATRSDVLRCYATPGQVFRELKAIDPAKAKAFWWELKSGSISRAEDFMHYVPRFRSADIKPFDGGTAHQTARNAKTGRVPKNQKAAYVVKNTRNLNAYVKKQVRLVGLAKAGWAACAREIGGTRGIPQWVTRHIGHATGQIVRSGADAQIQTVSLINQVPYSQNILPEGEKKEAVYIAFQRLKKQAEIAAKKISAANPFP